MFNYLISSEKHIFFFACSKKPDGMHSIRLLCCQNGKFLTSTTLTLSNLRKDINRLSNLIPGFNRLKCTDGTPLAINLYERLEKGEFHVYDEVSTLGWQPPENEYCRYAGTQLLAPNGKVLFSKLNPDFPKMAGAAQDWCGTLNQWSKGKAKRQALLAISLAAPLAGLQQQNLVVALVGNSSNGKTTAAKLAISLFTPPNYDRTSLTFNATKNALMESLHGNEGVPVLIDDTIMSKSKNFETIIYTLNSGIAKTPMKTSSQVKKTKNWHTSIFLTSETSLLDNRSKNHDGILGRLIEIPISGNDLFDSSSQVQDIRGFFKGCYGVAGAMFVRHLLQISAEDIAQGYEKWKRQLEQQSLITNNLVYRQIEQIALVGFAAELAQEIGLTLDAESIAQYLLDCTLDSIENDAASAQSSKSAEELIEDKIQCILSEGSDEIYKGQKSPFLPVSAGVWREFIHSSGIGAHNISRIREQLGYASASLNINGTMKRGFYLNKGGEQMSLIDFAPKACLYSA